MRGVCEPHGHGTLSGNPLPIRERIRETPMSTLLDDGERQEPSLEHHPGGAEGHHLLELWSDREEIHALPEILRPAEGLVAVGSGTVVRTGRLSQSRWLVVVTDRRLLCIKGRHAVTRKVIDMPIGAIKSVESSGLWRKVLVLETGYGTLRISGLRKNVAAEMVTGITALMGGLEGTPEHATAVRRAELPDASKRADAVVAQAMAEMRQSVGALTEEINELRGQVAFLEGLVRANVETGHTGVRENA